MRNKFIKVLAMVLSFMFCFLFVGCNKNEKNLIVNPKAYHYSSYACFLNSSFGESQNILTNGSRWRIQIISKRTINNINLLDYAITGGHELELAINSFEQNELIGEQKGYKIYDVELDATVISNASLGNEAVKVDSVTLEIETSKGKTTITEYPDIMLTVYYVPEKILYFTNYSSEIPIEKLGNSENYSFNGYSPILLTSSKTIILKSIDFSGENVMVDKNFTTTDYTNLNQMLTTSDEWTSFSGVAKINKTTFDYLGEHIVVSYSLLGETEIIKEPVFFASLSLFKSSINYPNLTFNQYIN